MVAEPVLATYMPSEIIENWRDSTRTREALVELTVFLNDYTDARKREFADSMAQSLIDNQPHTSASYAGAHQCMTHLIDDLMTFLSHNQNVSIY